jgi:hypothetical protein
MTQEGLRAAAQLGVLGINPLLFVNSRDHLERAMLQRVAEYMLEEKKHMDENLAIAIANAVGKLFKA